MVDRHMYSRMYNFITAGYSEHAMHWVKHLGKKNGRTIKVITSDIQHRPTSKISESLWTALHHIASANIGGFGGINNAARSVMKKYVQMR